MPMSMLNVNHSNDSFGHTLFFQHFITSHFLSVFISHQVCFSCGRFFVLFCSCIAQNIFCVSFFVLRLAYLFLFRSVSFALSMVASIQSVWPSFSHSVIHVNMSLWQLRNCSLMMFLKFRFGVCFVYLHRYNLEARFERTHTVCTHLSMVNTTRENIFAISTLGSIQSSTAQNL